MAKFEVKNIQRHSQTADGILVLIMRLVPGEANANALTPVGFSKPAQQHFPPVHMQVFHLNDECHDVRYFGNSLTNSLHRPFADGFGLQWHESSPKALTSQLAQDIVD